MSEDNDDWSEKTDMTRIEDLSDFLHEEDPELDEKLGSHQDTEEPLEVSDLEDGPSDESDALEESDDLEDDFSSFGNEEEFETDQEDQEDDEDSPEDGPGDNQEDLTANLNNDLEDNESEEATFGDDDNSFGSSSEFEEETQPNFELPPDFNENDGDDEKEVEDNLEESDDDFSFTEETSSFSHDETNNDNDNDDELESNDEDFPTTDSSEDHLRKSESPLDIPVTPDTQKDQINTTHKTQENFQELRDYGNAISYGNVTTGGNPPFSIILRNIIYKEDAEDIFSILKEFGVVTPDTELTTRQGLESGSLLISQISEYSAIFLAHKFRRFNLEIRIGLSEQLHHSKSYESHGKGLITKDNIHQNIKEEVTIKRKVSDVKDIILVTTANLNDFDIHRYIEVITSHTLISHDQLEEIDMEEVSYHASINDIYQELASQLKSQAFKIGANAVTGINYSLTPLPIDKDTNKQLYKVTCFGNAVLAIFKKAN